MFTLALTIVPSILIICVIVFSDRFVEPFGTVMYSFLLGMPDFAFKHLPLNDYDVLVSPPSPSLIRRMELEERLLD